MDNLAFGLWMTAIGMGTVFGLLLLLMLVLRFIGWLDTRGDRQVELSAGEPDGEPDAIVSAPDDLTEEEIAAIALAVVTHARVRRQQAAPAMRAHEPGSHLFANRWVGIGRGYQQQPWMRG